MLVNFNCVYSCNIKQTAPIHLRSCVPNEPWKMSENVRIWTYIYFFFYQHTWICPVLLEFEWPSCTSNQLWSWIQVLWILHGFPCLWGWQVFDVVTCCVLSFISQRQCYWGRRLTQISSSNPHITPEDTYSKILTPLLDFVWGEVAKSVLNFSWSISTFNYFFYLLYFIFVSLL